MLANNFHRFGYVLPLVDIIFRPQIEFARRHIVNRLLPTFDEIETEAEQHGHEVFDELMGRPGDGSDDGSAAAESAENAAIDYYVEAFGFKQGFLNLLFVHLFHLFEQQLAQLVRSERRSRKFEYNPSFDLYQGVFDTFGFDITFFDAWKSIEELRWIANTAKHAEAKDAAKLKARRPELFIDPRMPVEVREEWKALTKNWRMPTEVPLVGEFFYPQVQEYEAKVQAVLAFWTEFCAIIRGEKRELRTLSDWVKQHRSQIISVAEKRGASNVRVFGSVARGQAGPKSDVDLLVKAGEKMGLFQLVGLQQDLEELLDHKVDVVTEGGIKPRHRDAILREAVPL